MTKDQKVGIHLDKETIGKGYIVNGYLNKKHTFQCTVCKKFFVLKVAGFYRVLEFWCRRCLEKDFSGPVHK